MDLVGQREQLFPDLQASVYWAFAAIAPLASPVRAAVDAWHARLAREGMPAFMDGLAARESLRAELAGLLGGDAASYGLLHGTTAGVIALARSLPWSPGDRVVLFDDEFPANTVPWRQVAHDHRVSVDVVPLAPFATDPAAGLAQLEHTLRRGARLVALSAVEFQTGLAMPIGDIVSLCHRYGAWVAVDAIQAAGIVPLDFAALGVDFAIGGGHKWLCGTDGAGWIYVAPHAREHIGPAMAGWTSFAHGTHFLFEANHLHDTLAPFTGPRVLESGSTSTAAAIALLEGVKLCRAVTPAVAYAHVQMLHDRVEPGLRSFGFSSERTTFAAGRSGTLSARPPAGVSLVALQAALAARGVIITIPDGRLRLAPHFASTVAEADLLLVALGEVLPEVGG